MWFDWVPSETSLTILCWMRIFYIVIGADIEVWVMVSSWKRIPSKFVINKKFSNNASPCNSPNCVWELRQLIFAVLELGYQNPNQNTAKFPEFHLETK